MSETHKIVRQQEIDLLEFGEIVYVKRDKESFMIRKEDLAKFKMDPWNYRTDLHMWTNQYLSNYDNGEWWEFDSEGQDQINLLAELQNGNSARVFMGSPGIDGFIYHLDGTPRIRKICCEFWEEDYPEFMNIKVMLDLHPSWLEVTVTPVPGYNQEICGNRMITAKYLPTQAQLNFWLKKRIGFISGSHGVIHNFEYIKKYRKS